MSDTISPAPIRPPVVEDASQLSPEWLSAVLAASGHPNARVRSFRHRAVGTGQMAHSERIELDYHPNRAGSNPPGAPLSVVGKFASPSPESRASGARGGYRAETRFYTDLAARLPIRTPRCLYGAIAPDESTFTLILEDMAPAVQGDQIAGASAAALEAAVRNLAGLHAPLWNAPELDRLDWTTGGAGAEFARYVEMATPVFLDRYADRLAAEDRDVLVRFAEKVQRWVALRPADRTLVHGDYRLDNLLFREGPDGCVVTTVDWQTLSVACGGQDLGYLLGNSCEPPQRRAHERRMLAVYRDALAALGVERRAEDVYADYVYGSFQGPIVTVLGALAVGRTERGDDMFMAMARRSAAQIRDLDALATLD
ncbi:MAG: aminoglycoside phosphotransferase family protein [Deltaproteobacteria bacterium]|nr:aminoglycoside phosphotransferase family protein [Deltaproteobacteria bacterium]